MRVLVTGGSGMLGRQVVRELRSAGQTVRVLSHRAAGDGDVTAGIEWARGELASSVGLREAVAGVDAIVHAATRFPMRSQRKLPSVDVDGTQALLRAASEAGVAHLLYVSIVGIEHVPRFTYYRRKLQAEEMVRTGSVPWSIVRATQFYPLAGTYADAALRLPIALVPAETPLQPVAVADVAALIASRIEAGPSQRMHEIVGPTILSAAELVRSMAHARGQRRPVVPVLVPGHIGHTLRSGALTSPHSERGTHTWAEWLRSAGREREIAEYWRRQRDLRHETSAAARDATGLFDTRATRRGALAGERSGR